MNYYVIYDHPSDYPQHYVVRKWAVSGEDDALPLDSRACATIEEARSYIPAGLVMLRRDASDDPVILETWL